VSDDEVSRMNARIGAYAGTGKPDLPDGIDWFEHLQKPDVPKTSDPLARFVTARIIELETEPRSEIRPLYDQPGGAMAHRYAKHVRADCVVFRQIVLRYCEFVSEIPNVADSDWYYHGQFEEIATVMKILANRWSDHREFDEAWRPT
jgi:hypothetical protein